MPCIASLGHSIILTCAEIIYNLDHKLNKNAKKIQILVLFYFGKFTVLSGQFTDKGESSQFTANSSQLWGKGRSSPFSSNTSPLGKYGVNDKP
jgi:hypothetical protein